MKTRFGTTLAAALAATALQVMPVAAEQFNANTYMPETHPLGKLGLMDFSEDVKGRTDGAIDFKVFTGGVLVPPRASLSAIGDDIAQVGFFAGTYTPKELPVANLVASLAFENTDPLVQALASTEFSMTNQAQLDEWQRNKIVFGGGYSTPPYNLFCSSRVETLDDLQGKKLRMPGGVYERWAEYMGAVPVNISSNEMYTGLEKGALDCAGNANDALKSHSLWEVADSATLTEAGVYYSGAMYGYNPRFWAGLSSEQREVLFDAMAEHIVHTTLGYQQMHNETLTWAEEQGLEVIEPAADLTEKTAEFVRQDRSSLIERTDDEGVVSNPQEVVDDYLRLVEKWEGLLADVDRSDRDAVASLVKDEIYGKIDAASYGVN